MIAKIVFDFTAANTQAKRLEDTAAAIRQLANSKLENISQQLGAAWQGEAGAAYQEKLRELQQSIANTAKDLDNVAANLRYRSRKMYEAEMAAARIAQTGGN